MRERDPKPAMVEEFVEEVERKMVVGLRHG